MADTARPVEINGLIFASTSDGHLLVSEVRAHVEALQRELADLRARLEHVASLERLAQATVMKADDLAAEIEAEARRRVDQMTEACETELVERRRQFDVESSAQQAAAQARVAQLQAALEGTLQTLGRALQAAGAPALEMPAASLPAWSAAPPPVASPAVEANGQDDVAGEVPAATALSGDAPHKYFGVDPGPTAVGAEILGTDVETAPPAPTFAPDGAEPVAKPLATSAASADLPEAAESAAPEAADADWAHAADAPEAKMASAAEPDVDYSQLDGAETDAAPDRGGHGTFELTRPARPTLEPTPIRPAAVDAAGDEAPAAATSEPGPKTLSRIGTGTLEIDMRPVKSFADLARVTKLLGRIAPGAQPVDLNLPQHRALFSVRGKDPQALAAQLQEALPEARVLEREEGLDVLLKGDE